MRPLFEASRLEVRSLTIAHVALTGVLLIWSGTHLEGGGLKVQFAHSLQLSALTCCSLFLSNMMHRHPVEHSKKSETQKEQPGIVVSPVLGE